MSQHPTLSVRDLSYAHTARSKPGKALIRLMENTSAMV
jgi:hypothetical protein